MAADPLPEGSTPRPPTPQSGVGEILLAAFISMMLFGVFLAVPIVGALALPFLSVPAVRLAFRRGVAVGVLAALLASSVLLGLGLATGGSRDAMVLALFATVATALPPLFAAGARGGASPSRLYLALCSAGFAILAAGLALRPAAGGKTMRQEIAAAFDEMAPVPVQSYTRGG